MNDLTFTADTLYIGGNFTQVNGVGRSNLAAISLATGQLKSWNPGADAPVRCLGLYGSRVFAGGEFFVVDGSPHTNLVAIDALSGVADAWSPAIIKTVPSSVVITMSVTNTAVYFGGAFDTVDGQGRQNLAAYDADTLTLLPWNPNPNTGSIWSSKAQGDVVYVGGSFTIIGATPAARNRVAALDLVTGNPTAWDVPVDDGVVFAIDATQYLVLIGGTFTSIGGTTRGGAAVLSPNIFTLLFSDFNFDNDVYTIGFSTAPANTAYFGGAFTSINGDSHDYAAAGDPYLSVAKPWLADADTSPVRVIRYWNGKVYIGGDFGSINGVSKPGLAVVYP